MRNTGEKSKRRWIKQLILLFIGLSCFSIAQAQKEGTAQTSRNATDTITPSTNNKQIPILGKGISFRSKGDKFSVRIRPRFQSLVEFDLDEDFHQTSSDAEIRILRLTFDGYLFSPKFLYVIQLQFAQSESKKLPNGNTNILGRAVISYKPNNTWLFSIGQSRVNLNRAFNMAGNGLEFTERSIAATTFNTDRDFGIFADFRHTVIGKFNMRAKASITTGEGRNWGINENNSGFAYTGRLEFYPFGWFKRNGDMFEGDLVYEETPKLVFGAGYSYNDRAIRLRGQLGDLMPDDESRTLKMYYADVLLKYRGFSFATDFLARDCAYPLFDSDPDVSVFTGKGVNLQASYILPKHWGIALRNSTVFADKEIRSVAGYKHNNQTTFALSKYIQDHHIKAIADASYYHRKEATDAYTHWQFRFLLEIGI